MAAEYQEHFGEHNYDEEGRRQRIKIVLKGLNKKIKDPNIQRKVSDLIQIFSTSIKTNLSDHEFMSLFKASLANQEDPILKEVPLLPRKQNQILRQIQPDFQGKFIPNEEL